jgi:hypothetical protein
VRTDPCEILGGIDHVLGLVQAPNDFESGVIKVTRQKRELCST